MESGAEGNPPSGEELVTLSDEQLVARVIAGPDDDLRPFDRLVERHKSAVMTNCRYISGSPADAEDLAQEVFLKAYYALARFEQRARFKTWLQRIKVNHCLNFLDKKKRRGGDPVDIDAPAVVAAPAAQVGPRAEQRLHQVDQRQRIAQVLDSLPETLRVALIMRDMDGLPYGEIAEDLGIGLSAVKMRIKRAREAFREQYAPDPEAGSQT